MVDETLNRTIACLLADTCLLAMSARALRWHLRGPFAQVVRAMFVNHAQRLDAEADELARLLREYGGQAPSVTRGLDQYGSIADPPSATRPETALRWMVDAYDAAERSAQVAAAQAEALGAMDVLHVISQRMSADAAAKYELMGLSRGRFTSRPAQIVLS